MRREIHKWYSPRLYREMEVAVYGHYGFALLLFPTAGADYLEYERFNLIERIRPFIEQGKCKVYSINSVNRESWLNRQVEPRVKSLWQQAYNNYVTEEVVPFIHQNCHGLVPIITGGASLGAFQSANAFFRRPDIFSGVVAMSGSYDLKDYSDGYFDDIVYFNSPIDYMYHLNDEHMLWQLRNNKHIHIMAGQGNYEKPSASIALSQILWNKGISHDLDLWGHDMPHDWPTWYKMLPYAIGAKL